MHNKNIIDNENNKNNKNNKNITANLTFVPTIKDSALLISSHSTSGMVETAKSYRPSAVKAFQFWVSRPIKVYRP